LNLGFTSFTGIIMTDRLIPEDHPHEQSLVIEGQELIVVDLLINYLLRLMTDQGHLDVVEQTCAHHGLTVQAYSELSVVISLRTYIQVMGLEFSEEGFLSVFESQHGDISQVGDFILYSIVNPKLASFKIPERTLMQ